MVFSISNPSHSHMVIPIPIPEIYTPWNLFSFPYAIPENSFPFPSIPIRDKSNHLGYKLYDNVRTAIAKIGPINAARHWRNATLIYNVFRCLGVINLTANSRFVVVVVIAYSQPHHGPVGWPVSCRGWQEQNPVSLRSWSVQRARGRPGRYTMTNWQCECQVKSSRV